MGCAYLPRVARHVSDWMPTLFGCPAFDAICGGSQHPFLKTYWASYVFACSTHTREGVQWSIQPALAYKHATWMES